MSALVNPTKLQTEKQVNVSGYNKSSLEGRLIVESRFENGYRVCAPTSRYATYPLRFLFTDQKLKLNFTKENRISNCTWIYIITFGGGFVSGDSVNFEVIVKNSSNCVFTTQASTKVYKSSAFVGDKESERKHFAVQKMKLEIEKDAFVCVLPDPVQCFRDARYKQIQQIEMAPSSNLLLVDWLTAGRLNRERWDFLSYASSTSISIAEELVCLENVKLEPGNGLTIAKQMGKINSIATVILVGEDILQNMQSQGTWDIIRQNSNLISCRGELDNNRGVVLRLASDSTETIQLCLQQSFSFIEERIGRKPFE
mmetsp:Transcript_4767/g.6021  ORF Transcript_4767/g.6021 Transcript_4767/m.6021 type:complete len:312 (-) Transcript_4767:1896-2831(-)